MSTALTVDQFKAVLPPQVKKGVNQELIDTINTTLSNPEMMEQYRDNLLSYTSVLTEGKFKLQSYLDSVRYVSFKLLGGTNLQAYVKTYPLKYQRFLDDGISSKDIASYVSAFNKSKLVNLIWAQTMIPTHVLNADLFQRALNKQATIMDHPEASFKVQSEAANYLMTALKAPETKKIELDIGVKESSVIDDLRQATMRLTEQHRLQIASGASTVKEVAHSTIIDAVYEEV
jgi:hypothetical protein